MSAGGVCLFFLIAFAVRGQRSSQIVQDIKHGLVLQGQGRFVEAERQFESAVRDAELTRAPADLQVSALSNLASIQIDLSRLDEAARTYQKALETLQKDSPASTDRIRILQVRLAELYLEAGHGAIAEKLLAHVMSADFLFGESPEAGIAYAFDVQASVYSHHRKFASAEAAERKSLSILGALKNPDTVSVAIGTLHLSTILNLRNRPADALPYARQALEMFTALAIPQPGMQASAEINLASIYSRLDRPNEAELTSQAAVEKIQQFYGWKHPNTALMLLAQAAVLRAIGNKKVARLAQTRGEQILAGRQTHRDNTVPVNALLTK